ncbi:MAG: hypothetical protein LBM96_06410 [Methanobrevibacter sp.]|jgi:hypothetical protein|nr:hypothetical protein [Candidatus Methanoflexus mossambicus]
MKRKGSLKIVLIIIVLIIIFSFTLFTFLSMDFGGVIGNNTLGSVKKYTYGDNDSGNIKIAIVSGMHPRENLSERVLPLVSKQYSQPNLSIVNYNVIVTKDENDFYNSRSNGESLVRDFVIPDILKNDFDLVIIGHDHEKGYGQDYYIATPNMDDKSVLLAQSVYNLFQSQGISDFRHYQRNASKNVQSTSILGVNKLIVDAGIPLFVYEVPEWYNDDKTYDMTVKLLDNSIISLNGNQ